MHQEAPRGGPPGLDPQGAVVHHGPCQLNIQVHLSMAELATYSFLFVPFTFVVSCARLNLHSRHTFAALDCNKVRLMRSSLN